MSGGYYQGSADPGTGTTDYGTKEFHIDQKIAEISTATIVKIVRAPYDANGVTIPPGTVGPIGYVDVQPMVNQVDGFGNAVPHGPIYKLAYMRYQGANGAIISDPCVNDIGKMVVADRDTSAVRATGAQANPASRRKFDKADGTYFGSVIGGTPAQGIAFSATGLVVFDRNKNTITMGPSGIVLADMNGNTITMASGGITFKVKSGGLIQSTAGGTEHFVQTNGGSGTSNVLKADS